MNSVLTYEPPDLALAKSPAKWEQEYLAFRRLLPTLLTTHFGKYVAIHNQQVVASGDDEIALTRQVFAKVGNVPIHVGLVTDTAVVERVPHYRVLDS